MGETRKSVLVDDALAVGTHVYETVTPEREVIVVYWTMTNATNVADIDDTEVRLVDPDGNVISTVLTPEVLSAATLDGSVLSVVHRYDVRGVSGVEVTVTNAAASSRNTKIFVNHYWA